MMNFRLLAAKWISSREAKCFVAQAIGLLQLVWSVMWFVFLQFYTCSKVYSFRLFFKERWSERSQNFNGGSGNSHFVSVPAKFYNQQHKANFYDCVFKFLLHVGCLKTQREHPKNSGDAVFVSGNRVHSDGHRFLGFAAEEPEELELNQLSIDAGQRLHPGIPDLVANEWFGIYKAVF